MWIVFSLRLPSRGNTDKSFFTFIENSAELDFFSATAQSAVFRRLPTFSAAAARGIFGWLAGYLWLAPGSMKSSIV